MRLFPFDASHGGLRRSGPDYEKGIAVIRSELVQKLCDDHPDLTLKEVERVVSAFFDSIIEQLQNGGRVE